MADESVTTGDTGSAQPQGASDVSQAATTSRQPPVNKKNIGHSAFAAYTKKMEERYEEIAHETRGRHLVGIGASDFMSKFMPWNESTSKEYREMTPDAKRLADLKSVKPKPGEVEKDMYAKYVRRLF